MKICDGKKGEKKPPTVSDLDDGAVFQLKNDDKHGIYRMATGRHSDKGRMIVRLTSEDAGDLFDFLKDTKVTAVYPNACINPGEAE